MLDVILVSPASLVTKEKASSVTLPGSWGYLDIRENHADFLTEMKTGLVTLKGEQGEKNFFVSGGYAKVKDNQLTLLADIADSPEQIDPKRAKAAEKRARERLVEAAKGNVEIERAMASLARSLYRQRLCEKTSLDN